MDINQIAQIVGSVVIAAVTELGLDRPKRRGHNSRLSGAAYTKELLEGTGEQCFRMTRLTPLQFADLLEMLESAPRPLRSSRWVKSDQKLMIFLVIMACGYSNREAQDRFQHSGSTISV